LKFNFLNRYAGVIPANRQTMPHKTFMNLKHNYFLSATLAQTFNNRFSRLDWCGNYNPGL
jgi:hypothetical protein